ncbi:MAG: chemotaxis protein CheW [Candidatus Competibacteraceae bacterium]
MTTTNSHGGDSTLEGLSNLRGLVLPVISLRRLFRFPDRPHDDATRALVIDFGSPAGFVVDRVASVITVELDQIESATAIQATIDSDLLLGVIKNIGGHTMVMILDFARLIQNEFASLARNREQATTATGGALTGETAKGVSKGSDELQLVSFVVAGQEYAIDIERVQEIVQVPEQIIHVPKAAAHVIGVMTLRQRLLPLVSLRRMFNLPVEALGEHNRIVVISLSGGDQLAVGVVTDTVNEVLRVSSSLVDTMPALLARDADIAEITDICRLNDGKRLVSIISAEKMFAHTAFREAAAVVSELQEGSEAAVTDKAETQSPVGEDEQMVVFRLMKEEFGVPIGSVQEIVRVPEQLAHVPKAPEFIEGVINLRGTVLPVVDQRRRFGLPPLERNDRQRIMVFTINGVRTGFIVDSVTEVLKISRQVIEDAPNLSEETSRLIRRVANLQKQRRMILLLDVDQLLAGGEVKALEQAMA